MRTAAVVQGLALVAVPTLSSVLTDRAIFGLSQTAYGTLFVPQTVLAIIFSLAGGTLTRRLGIKHVLLLGFTMNALAMILLAASARLTFDHQLTYIALLVATGCLGFGFAIVTPALNILSGAFDPKRVDRAVLVVNALLGAAAALAPVMLIAFVRVGMWWALPALAGFAMTVLVGAAFRLPFAGPRKQQAATTWHVPRRFWVFAVFALVYGFCEQMNGSWAPSYMTHHLGAAASSGLLALTLFWTLGAGARVGFALSSARLPSTVVFCVLPFVLAAAFGVLAFVPAHAAPLLGIMAFALAGLGISALLPLTISFSERSMPEQATSVTSFVFAIYLMGYGFAAFGAGPLQHAGFGLSMIYGACAALALCAAAIAFAIVGILKRAHPSVTTLRAPA